jgi:hypothetical protein
VAVVASPVAVAVAAVAVASVAADKDYFLSQLKLSL